ncbi:MAG TPA: hypothetical protein VMU34_05580 [Mycobacterium sp.]|nr:hypothetical protein [Mycobacterium sp.]
MQLPYAAPGVERHRIHRIESKTTSKLRSPRSSRVRHEYLDDTPESTHQPDPPELAAAWAQARDEAARLREAGPLTDGQRRQLLIDLASRLNALMRHLSAGGVPGSAYSALLVSAARTARGGTRRRRRVLGLRVAGTRRLRWRHRFAGQEAARVIEENLIPAGEASNERSRQIGYILQR